MMDKQLQHHILACPDDPPHKFCNEVKPLLLLVLDLDGLELGSMWHNTAMLQAMQRRAKELIG